MKYEEVYLKAYTGGRDARIGIGEYFRFYNTERPRLWNIRLQQRYSYLTTT